MRAGPGPHNSVCGPGPGQVCTTAAGPSLKSYLRAGPGPTFQARAGPYCTVWTAMQDILHGFLKDTNFFSCSSSPDTTIFCRAQSVQTTCLSSFSPISANFHISVMCLIVLASLYRVVAKHKLNKTCNGRTYNSNLTNEANLEVACRWHMQRRLATQTHEHYA